VKRLAKAYVAGIAFLLLNIVWCCLMVVLIPALIFSDGDNCALDWGESLVDKLWDWVNKV